MKLTSPGKLTAPQLITAGYIRNTIGQLDTSGQNYITPMLQTVRITAALSGPEFFY